MNNELLAAFGITEEDLDKESKKKTASKSGRKNTSGKKKVVEYKRPVHFCGEFRYETFSGEGTITKEEIKKVVEERYRELTDMISEFEIVKGIETEGQEDSPTYIKPVLNYIAVDNDKNLKFPISVLAGCTEGMVFEKECTLQEISKAWLEKNPDFEDCVFHYNEKANTLIPFFEETEPTGVEYDLPISVGLGTVKIEVTEETAQAETVSYEKVREIFSSNYPEYRNCGFVYNQSRNQLIPVMKNEKKAETKECKVLLPADVRAGGFRMTIQPEDISNQRLATLEEIRNVIERIYPEYSKERTEMIYDDAKKIVIPILKSSRKGLLIHNIQSEWEHIEENDTFGNRWRKEIRPFGVFKRNETENGGLKFELTAPRIPVEIFNEIVRRFRRNPLQEAAIQIFYNTDTKEYELYEPPQRKNAIAVQFLRNSKLEEEKVLVMDVHSHGKMHAFFSAIDDHDEQGVRLYMVLGNLDCTEYSLALRAGMAGHFANLEFFEVFEEEV